VITDTRTRSSTGGVDIPPPPRETLTELTRRWWRAWGRHQRLRYWLLLRGIPILLVFACLFAANGLIIGWRAAYDVMLGTTSPADADSAVLAWLLSIMGWLIGPAVAGAVVGYIVTAAIGERRTKSIDQLFPAEVGDD
jgi:Family of unknown function (DUF6313)